MNDHVEKVVDYFHALNARDIERATRSFHPTSHTVKNAAHPQTSGPTAMEDTIKGLFERTERAEFMVRSIGEVGNVVLADWAATFVFAEGAVLNGQETHKFRTPLEGIDVFVFDADGLITEVQIIHETASVARGIAANKVLKPTSQTIDPSALVQRYLTAEEDEDIAALTEMFAESVVVRNAANPPDALPGSLRRYLESFWERTERREFVLHAAEFDGDGGILAYFTSAITFKKGAAFGPVVAEADFSVELPTALRFHLDGTGKITEVNVYHETTTPLVMAQKGSG